jgi:hypothetical protein
VPVDADVPENLFRFRHALATNKGK